LTLLYRPTVPPFNEDQLQQFKTALQHPNLIHWAGTKPWQTPSFEWAEKWWAIAKQTPFYEEVLISSCRHVIREELKALIKKVPALFLKKLARFKKKTQQTIAAIFHK
jgi:lipopolysaccharide biosynthesis glycosyltransferase